MEKLDEDAVRVFGVDPQVVGAGGGLLVVGDAGDSTAVGAHVSHGVPEVVYSEGDEVDALAPGVEELAHGTVASQGFDELDDGPGAVAEEGVAVSELGVVVGRLHHLQPIEVAEPVGSLLKVMDGDADETQLGWHGVLLRAKGQGIGAILRWCRM